MATSHAPNVRYTDAQIEELLLDLNHEAVTAASLPAWTAASAVGVERLTATRSLVYIRLTERDSHDDRVVLMLLDGTWERAL
jgi:hypothetical protein